MSDERPNGKRPNDKSPSGLRLRRVLRCLTLEDVAAATGIDKSDLSRLERGKQPLKGEMRRRLAELYQVSPDQLEIHPLASAAGGEG